MKLSERRPAGIAGLIFAGAALAACGGGGGGGGPSASSEWSASAVDQGVNAGQVENVDLRWDVNQNCDVTPGTVIVNTTDVDSSYNGVYLYAWKGRDKLAAWPGVRLETEVSGACASTNFKLETPAGVVTASSVPALAAAAGTDLTGYSFIVNDGGAGGLRTADVVNFSFDKPCLLVDDDLDESGNNKARFVTARECGVSVGGDQTVPDEVYLMVGGEKVTGNDNPRLPDVVIEETEGDPASAYKDITLLIRGAGADTTATGRYWFDDDYDEEDEDDDDTRLFYNGQVIRVGDGVRVRPGETKNVFLYVRYVPEGSRPVVKKFLIRKTYASAAADPGPGPSRPPKDEFCRLYKDRDDYDDYYDDDDYPDTLRLGAVFDGDETEFRIWNPEGREASVVVNGHEYRLRPDDEDCYTGVWDAEVHGVYPGARYRFVIGGESVLDPYGKMISEDGAENVVIDLSRTNPAAGWAPVPELKNRADAVIYAADAGGFTSGIASLDPSERGKYPGLTRSVSVCDASGCRSEGIDHLKELGVTHVELRQIWSGDPAGGSVPWGFSAPSAEYTALSGEDSYHERIREVKTMINEFHKAGIRVILTVGYDHTGSEAVFGPISSSYYLSGATGVLDADNDMVWKMIRDSLDYWVSEYRVDGFRLDNAGSFALSDYADWAVYLNRAHPRANLLFYGDAGTFRAPEAYAGTFRAPEAYAAVADPVRPGVVHAQRDGAYAGLFNDLYSNCLIGYGSTENGGFVFNETNGLAGGAAGPELNGSDENDAPLAGNRDCVFLGLTAGSRHPGAAGADPWSAQGFSDPAQAVNRLNIAGGVTLRDKIEARAANGGLCPAGDLEVYAGAVLLTGQGIPLIRSGDEFGAPGIPGGELDWSAKADSPAFPALANYVKMRREHPAFRMTSADGVLANVTLDPNSTDETVIVDIDGAAAGDSWSRIKLVLNSSAYPVAIAGADGMTKKASGSVTVYDGSDALTPDAEAAPCGVTVWAAE